MDWLFWVLFFIGGVLCCLLTLCVVFRKYYVGYLRVDRSDPTDPPYLFLELETFEPIERKKYVLMEVKRENFISRE